VGTLAAAIAIAVLVRPAPEPVPDVVVAGADMPVIDEDAWSLVVSFTDDLSVDELRQVAPPRAGVADAMIDALSAEERAEFVRLLKREMGGAE
jgi:hypothetical protein